MTCLTNSKMLRTVIVLITCTPSLVLCRTDTHRIAPGKFRFDDDIAYLKDDQTLKDLTPNVNTGDTSHEVQPLQKQVQLPEHVKQQEHKTVSGHRDGSFIRISALEPAKRIQSIGYTVDSYPNPGNSPGLCVQSSNVAHSMLCDPDSILSETQQLELNELLHKEREYRIFVALAHTILVPVKETNQQGNFTAQLLSKWANGGKDCILMVYVEDQGKLSIATNVPKDRITKDDITMIEDVFKREHGDVFTALKRAIVTVEGCLTFEGNGTTIVYIILLILAIGVCLRLLQKKMKQR